MEPEALFSPAGRGSDARAEELHAEGEKGERDKEAEEGEGEMNPPIPLTSREYAINLDRHFYPKSLRKLKEPAEIKDLYRAAQEKPEDYELRWILADCLEDHELGEQSKIQRLIGNKIATEYREIREACFSPQSFIQFLEKKGRDEGLFLFFGIRPHRYSERERSCVRCGDSIRNRDYREMRGYLPNSPPRQCTLGDGIPICCARKTGRKHDDFSPVVVAETSPNGRIIDEMIFWPSRYRNSIQRMIMPSDKAIIGKLETIKTEAVVYKFDSSDDMYEHPEWKFAYYVAEFLDWNISH